MKSNSPGNSSIDIHPINFQRNNVYYKAQNPLDHLKDKIQNPTKFRIKKHVSKRK